LNKNISKFEIKTAGNCVFSCLLTVLNHYNYNIDEVELFVLCNGLNIKYDEENKIIGFLILDLIGNLENQSICFIEIKKDKDFIDNLETIIDKGKLVFMTVTTSKMSYNEFYYKNVDRPHCILIYDIDKEERKAYIADTHLAIDYSEKTSSYNGETSINDIIEGGDMSFWLKNEKKAEISQRQIIKLFNTNLKRFLDIAGEKNTGLNALRMSIDDSCKKIELDDETFRQECIDINYNIRIRSFMYLNDYVILFIKKYEDILKGNIKNILNSLENIKLQWSKIAFSILKCGIKRDRKGFMKIIEDAKKIIEEQEIILTDLLLCFDC